MANTSERHIHTRALVAALFLWLLGVGMAASSYSMAIFADWQHVPEAFKPNTATLAGGIALTAFSSVGLLIAIRRPANRVGWLLLTVGVAAGFIDFPRLYAGLALYAHVGLPGALWLYWVSQFVWLVLFGELLILLPLIFPDGRLLSRRWWWPVAGFGLTVLLSITASLDPTITAPLPNPAGVQWIHGVSNVLFGAPFIVIFFGSVLGAMGSLVLRYRRGREQERQQLKWLLAAVGLLLIGLVVQILFPALQNSVLLPIAAASVAIAIGIAVLRYRLYDIDIIINRALAYGGLAVLITAVYVLVVVGLGALVGRSQQLLLSLAATAIIALAFQPLRQRAQQLANRLVYGKRATPYETLSQFSQHLSETFSQEDILDRMSRILAQGTGAERAEVWVRAGSHLLLTSASPAADHLVGQEMPMANGALPELRADLVAPVSYQGELLGAMAVMKKRGESINTVEQKLVTDLAGQAGLVLKNVGLNRELLARLDELQASRQRLVKAQDEERRRIERNIHDGAQQELVALTVRLGLLERTLDKEPEKAKSMVADLRESATAAVETLRELARGIYPPLLVSDGLAIALEQQVRRSPVRVDLDVREIPRQPKEVEAAVYFCCLEALQNIAKHAQASHASIRIWLDGAQLRFAVKDNGRGFDTTLKATSSGLQNMRDRMQALGGMLDLQSTPDQGTTVSGAVPVRLPAASAS